MNKKVAVIGSSGSVGRQAVEVCERLGVQVVALSANTNEELLIKQAERLGVPRCFLAKNGENKTVGKTRVIYGADPARAVQEAAGDCDLIIIAVAGFAGAEAVLTAVEAGKRVALATKEALVSMGDHIMKRASVTGAEIIPVDSEHSALFQSLGCKKSGFKRLILTASGGPFLHKSKEETERATAEEALRHPNWVMGRKITVDSATMLNKGFEVIEAHHLFSAPKEKIDVVVHPQSIVHSLVEFDDNSMMAELSMPSMLQPIQLALTYPEKLPLDIPRLDLKSVGHLDFMPLDEDKFPCFRIAMECLDEGGSAPAALNAASEVAVAAFLDGHILLGDIARILRATLDKTKNLGAEVEAIRSADAEARKTAAKITEKIARGGI